jgi:hypothetical protein
MKTFQGKDYLYRTPTKDKNKLYKVVSPYRHDDTLFHPAQVSPDWNRGQYFDKENIWGVNDHLSVIGVSQVSPFCVLDLNVPMTYSSGSPTYSSTSSSSIDVANYHQINTPAVGFDAQPNGAASVRSPSDSRSNGDVHRPRGGRRRGGKRGRNKKRADKQINKSQFHKKKEQRRRRERRKQEKTFSYESKVYSKGSQRSKPKPAKRKRNNKGDPINKAALVQRCQKTLWQMFEKVWTNEKLLGTYMRIMVRSRDQLINIGPVLRELEETTDGIKCINYPISESLRRRNFIIFLKMENSDDTKRATKHLTANSYITEIKYLPEAGGIEDGEIEPAKAGKATLRDLVDTPYRLCECTETTKDETFAGTLDSSEPSADKREPVEPEASSSSEQTQSWTQWQNVAAAPETLAKPELSDDSVTMAHVNPSENTLVQITCKSRQWINSHFGPKSITFLLVQIWILFILVCRLDKFLR